MKPFRPPSAGVDEETGKVKCPKCNIEVIGGNFCEHCGAKL